MNRPLLLGGESTALHWAAWTGDCTFLEMLPADTDLDRQDDQERSPLSYAAENGHEKFVTELLTSPLVDPRRTDKVGMTALSYAAKNGHLAVMKLLPCEEEDLNCRDGRVRTPLSYAAEDGHVEAVEWLLERNSWGLHPNIEDVEGRSPLWYAREKGHEQVANMLLRKGAQEVAGSRETTTTTTT
jgi:ankyrin repeat protein